MNAITTNQTSTLPTLDYPTFRQVGIDQLQTWVGRHWTDFNEHDPGITLLENFCYALTDLTYRLGYSVPDLLCQSDRDPYASLFTPAQILTTQPVTLLDLRKLVVDVRGVGNAWLIKVDDPSPTTYYHAGTLPNLPNDDSENFILLYTSQGGQTLNPGGLYQVLIAKSQTLDVDSNEIVGNVAARLHAHRQLGMDFDAVQVMDTQKIQVMATIEISADGDANSIYVAILQALANYIAPPIHFYTWQERLAAGKRIDEIFDGPILSQGFIDNDELQGMQQKTALRVSDCIQTIMDVEGVVMVKYIALNSGGLGWQNWSLDLDVTQSPILDFMGSTLSLERKELAVNLDMSTIQNNYILAQQGLGYQVAGPEDLDVMTAPGRNRQVGQYYSVQHQLPLVYGVGSFGLPPQADAQRCAQAKQLKAYMLLFEQLLADEFGQLSHLGDLLGFDGDDPTTYFAVNIDDPSLGLGPLWQQQDAQARQARLQQIVENPATGSDDTTPQVDWERRNRFLDHLLARFAEQYYDYAQFEPTPPDVGSALPRLAALKRAWLLSYPELSRGRGTGRDISKATNAANLAGLVNNLALKLGVSINTDSVSKIETVSSMAAAAYPPLPQDTDAGQFYLVEHPLLRPIDADGAQGWPLLANARCPDPYSLQISLVFPGDLPRYQSGVFRSFVGKTISAESPAHLSVYLVWLNQADMADFIAAYGDWLSFLSQYRQCSNDLGPHPDTVDHAISFQLRDARDRLIDLLGIGQTYPLADLALAGNQTIAWDETCQILLPFSQQGVIYALCDKTGTPLVPAIQVTGNGSGGDNSLYLETPPITEDITYTISATKPSGLSLMLNQSVDIKVGLDTSLVAGIVSANAQILDPSEENPPPTAARIVDYGASVQVQVQASQQGVAYTLQDASGNIISTSSVIGDLSSILLTANPVYEDLSISILATKTFDLTGSTSTQTALLNSVLPLMVRANPALAVTVPQPLVQYQQPTSIVVANTQASVTYQLFTRDILDSEYRHVGNADWGQALPVTGCSYARIAPSSLTAGLTDTGLSQAGNGGTLDLNTGNLINDSLLVVQATKSYQTPDGKTIQSIVQLTQPAIALVYPNPGVALDLVAIAGKAGSFNVNNGQAGVFYSFYNSGQPLGLPVYIHKQDQNTPPQNVGISQLAIQVNFAIPPAHPAGEQPPSDMATWPPETPEWDSGTTLPSNVFLGVQATNAQTGLFSTFDIELKS